MIVDRGGTVGDDNIQKPREVYGCMMYIYCFEVRDEAWKK